MDRFYWNMVRYQDKIEDSRYCISYDIAWGEIDIIAETWLDWITGAMPMYSASGHLVARGEWFDRTLANGKKTTDF